MINHVFLTVTNIKRSLALYEAALHELGWSGVGTYYAASGPEGIPDLYGIGDSNGAAIWLRKGRAEDATTHIGFDASDQAAVDAAYAAAIAAGARDNGGPAIRSYFSSGYYAANVFDLDGNSLEFVYHG
jgi:catechol 2,3-dioxygenase-like lactoylglutathione lyase family enzyme